jgi:hypothetical protein
MPPLPALSRPLNNPQRMSSSMQVSRTHCASFGLRGSLLGVGEALKREIAGIVITKTINLGRQSWPIKRI